PAPSRICLRRAVSVQGMCFLHRLDNDAESQPTDIAQPLFARALIVAGEVKKARSEVDELIKLMSGFAAAPDALLPSSGKARNAFKKVASLRKNRAELLWVVGPDRYGHVFEVQYGESEAINLQPVSQNILEFQNWG
ncbi:hypothetical protein, partial [Novosphingobium sp. FKTRR1]|uniref:hypothetical protein n=1 Tax=Novosphingobium sp. FKTRR1 TaxID=2879118 RepID=UPI001CF05E11